MHLSRFLLSAPIRLHWAGWETTTHKLQQAGWSLSVEQDMMGDRMRIMMQHNTMMMQAMTDVFDFQFRQCIMDRFHGPNDYLQGLIVPCQAIGKSITINAVGNLDWDMQPVDAAPMFSQRTIHRMEDLAHFAPAMARTNEIILPEEDVPALMEKILKLQDPARQARLKAELRQDRDGLRFAPHHKFHAQIISLAA